MNIKLEGNVCVPFTLEIHTCLSSIGCRSASKVRLGNSASSSKKVKKAREIQQIRYQNEPRINCNAQMSTALLQKYCVLDEKSRQLLKETSEKYGYSARVIHKLLRLARTSADLAEVENIRLEDVKRILNYRDLDRSNNKMLVVN